MAGRFDLSPLIGGVLSGLRKRENGRDAEEKQDWRARAILMVIPVLSAATVVILRIQLSQADQLLAGAALFTSALLVAFAQIAVWRERLLARNGDADSLQIRAMNEAAAHILLSLIVALFSVVVIVVLLNLDAPLLPDWMTWLPELLSWDQGGREWAGVILSALAVAAFAYLVLTLILVVNLLWDAFRDEEEGAEEAAARDLD
jgi:hypothetical protein